LDNTSLGLMIQGRASSADRWGWGRLEVEPVLERIELQRTGPAGATTSGWNSVS